MIEGPYPIYVAGEARQPNSDLAVTDKYSGTTVAHMARAEPGELEEALEGVEATAEQMAQMPSHRRREALETLIDRCREHRDELADVVCTEAGKPIQHARGEVTRTLDTLTVAAEEAVRVGGEVLPMDISKRAANYRGMWKRVPVGPCSFITPWNFPLNLVAHKIGPAIACGCPFILKPAARTPISAALLGKFLAEADLPRGAFSILNLDHEHAGPMITDERVKKLSFTGSAKVGWRMRRDAYKKHVTLELGGNAASVVEPDADIDDAVARNIFGGYYQSGQSCVSVQRVLVHENVYDEFKEKYVRGVKELVVGDPHKDQTFVGPLISEGDAERIEQWVAAAADEGAEVLCGGTRDKQMMAPTVLENVPRSATVYCEEVFGPVTLIEKYTDFSQAIDSINDSRFGLQAGVFTNDLRKMHEAWDTLNVGGVLINEVPSFRVDHMPYGGVKDSGVGREGIRWAIDSMTEVRLLAVRSV